MENQQDSSGNLEKIEEHMEEDCIPSAVSNPSTSDSDESQNEECDSTVEEDNSENESEDGALVNAAVCEPSSSDNEGEVENEEYEPSESESDSEEEVEPYRPMRPVVNLPQFSKFIFCQLAHDAVVCRMEAEIKIREFILCCVVKNVHFTQDTYLRFYNIKTSLHSISCDSRALATIGTHDFDKMGDNKTFVYTTRDPNEIMFRPLGSDTEISAADYFMQQKLKNENPEERDKVPHPFLQCLHMLDGAKTVPCFMSEDGSKIFSIPPVVTNTEAARITHSTNNIFIEVTSQHSYRMCKNVMDLFLIHLCVLGICDAAAMGEDEVNEDDQHYLYLAGVELNNCNQNGDRMCLRHYPSLNDFANFERDVRIVYY